MALRESIATVRRAFHPIIPPIYPVLFLYSQSSDITSVNVYRLIFNEDLEAGLEILGDRNYRAPHQEQFNFIELTLD